MLLLELSLLCSELSYFSGWEIILVKDWLDGLEL